ncbi:MAG: molybdopterin-dependent oxidoreductase [Chloroflexota bacterium]
MNQTPVKQTSAAAHRSDVMQRRGFLAGVGAALFMTAAMVALRYTSGIPSLPEILGEAIIGLMPAPIFSYLLDNLRTAAKPILYVGIFLGMLGVGGLLGRGFAWGDLTWRRTLKLGVIVWAVFGLVLMPLLGVGFFGTGVRAGTVTLAIQQAITVGCYAAALLLLLRAFEPAAERPAVQTSRRQALVSLAGSLVGVVAVGTAWRMLLNANAPQSTADIAPAGPAAAAPPVAEASPAPAAAASGPVTRAAPRLDSPSVPMTVMADQPAPPPFNVTGLTPEVLTPKEFYTVSKNLIDPIVNVNTWSLKIDGLVERPVTYVYDDITALPSHSDYYTLQCISNEVGGDLWGNAHWKGVRLVELLSRAGLKPGIRKVVFHADDGYTDSITLDIATRPDALLAYEMNGEQLPKEHGYPARLLIPGIYGMKNVKWITRIELVDYDFKGYWMQRGWSDTAPYNTSTRIDVPASRAQLKAGEIVFGGVTFAGFRGIDKVEVSLDDGQTWEPGELKPSLSLNAWNLWVFRKRLDPGTYQVKARAIDGTGETQTQFQTDPLPDGATGYHTIVLRVD